MPAAFTFCIPKRVLITYSCSKQRSEAWSSPSLNSSIYSGTLPWPPCLVWILILQARFRKVLVYFLFFSDFQRCQSGNEEWRLWSWLKINLHDKFSYWSWNEFYITFFFLLHFFRGILWQFSSCISVLYYILNEYIEEVYLHVVGYELKYPIQLEKDKR